MSYRSLTQLAQTRLAAVIHAGDYALDATVGNGHDTLFLAEQVGDTGHVWGLDVQPGALTNAHDLLAGKGLSERVSLIKGGHQHLNEQLPEAARGRLATVMFNLGYLPGSDRRVSTRPETTLPALDAALANLRPGGMLSVLAYRGHPGGQDEATAVERRLCAAEAGSLRHEVFESPGPVLHLLSRPA